MGQEDTNLPTSTESVASADDMLAQLAGEEVDRLLAEAETEAPPVADDAPAEIPVPESTADLPPLEDAIAVETPAGVDLPPEPATAEADNTPHAATDAAPPADVALPTEAAVATSAPPQPEATNPPTLNPEPSQAQLAAEGAVLTAAATTRNPDEAPPLPAHLRVLELLAAPLNPFPDWVRNAVGTFGLVTLFNAIAMLAYVRFFRHK